jgi:hypothetical protein
MSFISKKIRKIGKFLAKSDMGEDVEDRLEEVLEKVEVQCKEALSAEFTFEGQTFHIPPQYIEAVLNAVFDPIEKMVDMIDGKEDVADA